MKLPIEKAQQKKHMRTSKTGMVYSAGKGEEKEEKLEGSARYVKMYKDELKGRGATTKVSKWKKGLSDDVVFNSEFIDYVENSEFPGGYIGQSNRTPERDKILEDILRNQGLDGDGIATWLSSGNGRHLMDDVDKNTTDAQFKKRAKNFTSKAFEDVLLWSHPDADGGSEMKDKIGRKVYEHYKEQILKHEALRKDFMDQVIPKLKKQESKDLLNKQIDMIWGPYDGEDGVRVSLKNGGAIFYKEGHKITESDVHEIMSAVRYDKDYKEVPGRDWRWGSAIRFKDLDKKE